MFQIGEYVRYAQSGICRITSFGPMEIAGETKEYYLLEPLYRPGSVVYVPSDNPILLAKMLPPLTKGEVLEKLEQAAKAPVEWIRDFRRRSEWSKKALASDDRGDTLLLMKNIYTHRREVAGEGKFIHNTDDYFLKDAEALIGGEFAFVLGVEREEVLHKIREKLGF